MDKNGDNQISLDGADTEVDAFVKTADKDNDGILNQQEWKTTLTNLIGETALQDMMA
jgi:hypothetical protein